MTSAQQYEMMIVHQAHPLNASPFLEHIRQAFITPQERFFVRNHGAVPSVNVQRYRLSVTGMAEVPLEFSLDELRTCFPATAITATLQCAGNRRNELAAVQPIPGELAWGAEAISNATWRGVSLREILRVAGVKPAARHIAFIGLDKVQRGNELFRFGGSIPIEKAMMLRDN